jgi:hypothetical protein
MNNQTIPSAGEIVKVNCWNGIVRNVYTNGDANNPVVEIQFAKNVFRGQSSEYHKWLTLQDSTTRSSRELLEQEIKDLRLALDSRVVSFMA